MHRVELKAVFATAKTCFMASFLMHRVELKDDRRLEIWNYHDVVPNAPCGVERL